ncbi:MAG: 16S rRNA (guanine(966)-N(2))-methyltransferase RsmD [Clostridia bacterium]|nr:16S rRNA (guanine(966)-N(2))-methyltransferase RsmD [Clostridia bacterium]
MMRIITGKARGTHLLTLAGENTRPTAERVKEAVFSSLQSVVADAEVLDLFAGSGQMALEALSRGAARAVACDSEKAAVKVIEANADKTHLANTCEIFCMDYAALLRSMRDRRRFDLVFLDPPYAKGLLPATLAMLLDFDLLNADARVVCESADGQDVFGTDVTLAERYKTLRATRYGAAFVTVLTPKGEETL